MSPSMSPANAEAWLWVGLIKEGQSRSYIRLSESEEAYTVHLLQRHQRDPALINCNLALGYLESQEQSGSRQYGSLWQTADAGLLLAGLFPEQARARNVSASYFTGMSQCCFSSLAQLCDRLHRPLDAQTYRQMAQAVERVACVLHSVRRGNTTVHELLDLSGLK